jgi:hypothetical protein
VAIRLCVGPDMAAGALGSMEWRCDGAGEHGDIERTKVAHPQVAHDGCADLR